jgi:hypothetical protein
MGTPTQFRVVTLVPVVAAIVVVACGPLPLTQLVEARRLAADLHVQFTKAADAANRAVMADEDEDAAAAVREAREATGAVEKALMELQPLIASLGYPEERQYLDTFRERFTEHRKLDEEILPLAEENSNLKAQRLSFGIAQEAAEAFRSSIDAAARASTSAGSCCADALATRAGAALLEIQVLQAPHIAEAEDAAMTRMEQRMAGLEATAQKALDQLRGQAGAGAAPHITAASAALERFKSVNREIITLSRRNSEVRSLALSLGRKRMLTAVADDQLRALEDALAKHELAGRR